MARTKKRIKSEMSLIFGPEPLFDMLAVPDSDYNSVLGSYLRWYTNYGGVETRSALRAKHTEWLKAWAKSKKIKSNTFSIPTQGIDTMGALARLSMKGFPLKSKHVARLKQAFADWIPIKKIPVDKVAVAKQISLVAKIKNETALTPVLTIFDNAIDSIMDGEKTWNVDTNSTLNGKQSNELYSMYNDTLKQLNQAYDKSSQDIMENYDFPRLQLRRLINCHEEILAEILKCSSKGDAVRKIRKARAKKVIPLSAYVKNLQYKVSDPTLELASIDPETVIGAEVLYVYDSRKRLLKMYEAASSDGIIISGTTLKNVKCSQKVIRRPDEQLRIFTTATRKQLGQEFKAIRAKMKACTGRMNSDTLILRRFP